MELHIYNVMGQRVRTAVSGEIEAGYRRFIWNGRDNGGNPVPNPIQAGESMSVESAIRAVAGTFVIVSLSLGYLHSPYWHLFTAFVGLNLFQSAFTKWCPMENLLLKMGIAKQS